MVCRKFQFQAFNYLDENGKGTLNEDEAVQCTRSTAFVVSDHLAQLLINDGMSREGTVLKLTKTFSTFLVHLHTVLVVVSDFCAHNVSSAVLQHDLAMLLG
jgi:hypothetical protein